MKSQITISVGMFCRNWYHKAPRSRTELRDNPIAHILASLPWSKPLRLTAPARVFIRTIQPQIFNGQSEKIQEGWGGSTEHQQDARGFNQQIVQWLHKNTNNQESQGLAQHFQSYLAPCSFIVTLGPWTSNLASDLSQHQEPFQKKGSKKVHHKALKWELQCLLHNFLFINQCNFDKWHLSW